MKDRLLGRWTRYRNQQRYRRMLTTDVRATIQVLSGNIRKSALSACAIVRDEMYFLPSFLRHHRQLGVEQFLFLDDGSEDDSREYISRQTDCVLLQSSISYGTKDVLDCYPDGQRSRQRGGLWLKHHLTQNLVDNNFILYLDADEFLILPPSHPSLSSLIKELKAQNIKTTTAALVELFPESIEAMAQQQRPPETMADLLHQCGYYDHHALIQHRRMGGVKAVGQSATTRLFNQAGITAIGPKDKSASAIHKMPLFEKEMITGSSAAITANGNPTIGSSLLYFTSSSAQTSTEGWRWLSASAATTETVKSISNTRSCCSHINLSTQDIFSAPTVVAIKALKNYWPAD